MSVLCVSMLEACMAGRPQRAHALVPHGAAASSKLRQHRACLASTRATPVTDGLKHLPWSRWARAQRILGC